MTTKIQKQKQAEIIVARLVKTLRLNEWNITVMVMDDAAYKAAHGKSFSYDTDGCTEIDSTQNTAHVYVKESLNKGVFVGTIVHELVHLVTHRYDDFTRNAISTIGSRSTRRRLSNDAVWEMEIAVSRFTTILRPFLMQEFSQL